jgi:hypothetical protein
MENRRRKRFLKEGWERFKSETPSFWKKVRNASVLLGTIGTVILTAPVSFPAGLVAIAGYAVTAGTVGAILSQTTKKDEPKDNK